MICPPSWSIWIFRFSIFCRSSLLRLFAHPRLALDLLREHFPFGGLRIDDLLLGPAALGGRVQIQRVEQGTLFTASPSCTASVSIQPGGWRGNRDQTSARQNRTFHIHSAGIAAERDQRDDCSCKRDRRETGERRREAPRPAPAGPAMPARAPAIIPAETDFVARRLCLSTSRPFTQLTQCSSSRLLVRSNVIPSRPRVPGGDAPS